jgi:K+/H+ antiporter YhaU regulatory subunit KhtT
LNELYAKKDRRAVDVVITKQGLDLLEVLDETEKEWIREFKSIDKNEAKRLNQILDTLRGK